MKLLKESNKGVTLVELIVTVLIMGIMAGTIFLFVNASRNSYGNVYEEVTMQTEADIAVHFLDNVAQGALSYNYTDDFTVTVDGSPVTFDVLCIETLVPDPYYYFFIHAVEYEEIRFCKVRCDAPNTQLAWISGTDPGNIKNIDIKETLDLNHIYDKSNKRCFVSRYVTDFKAVIPDDVNKKGLLRINLELKYGKSKYSTSKNISSRNVI